jgi:hypothetical protein
MEVVIRHGPRVETADEWFCEAAWAGPYDKGGLDLTDIVAGTGGRSRNGRVTFVSSGSTVDRLQWMQLGGRILVSNSLACLLAEANASPDPTYSRYYRDFRTVITGLSRYKRQLATDRGAAELVYFDNLAWDGCGLERRAKPFDDRAFPDFTTYRAFLVGSMAALAGNLKSGVRRYPYSMLGTLSSGYDSSAVAVLAREVGSDEVLSFDRAQDGDDDRGAAVAAALGLRTIVVDRDAWRRREPFAEVPFLAANAYGEEVHFSGAEPCLAGRVLLTGFHGDKVWAKDTEDLSPDIVRGDPTGLALTEYRLSAGFLHCPIPFWGVRNIRQINAISHATEMAPWDVPGDYSRPICRRLVEEAGVPREAFGVRKRAASIVLRARSEGFLTPGSIVNYRGWLGSLGTWRWLRQGRVSPQLAVPLESAAASAHAFALRWVSAELRDVLKQTGIRRGLTARNSPTLFNHLFPWAMAHQKARYE